MLLRCTTPGMYIELLPALWHERSDEAWRGKMKNDDSCGIAYLVSAIPPIAVVCCKWGNRYKKLPSHNQSCILRKKKGKKKKSSYDTILLLFFLFFVVRTGFVRAFQCRRLNGLFDKDVEALKAAGQDGNKDLAAVRYDTRRQPPTAVDFLYYSRSRPALLFLQTRFSDRALTDCRRCNFSNGPELFSAPNNPLTIKRIFISR